MEAASLVDDPIYELNSVDRFMERIFRNITEQGPSLSVKRLASVRRRAIRSTLSRHDAAIVSLQRGLALGRPESTADLLTFVESALREMRSETVKQAKQHNARLGWIAAADLRWNDCQTEELMDDPNTDQVMRQRIMAALDFFNYSMGNYERFFDALLPFQVNGQPLRILDLAAGHGGFARAAARMARDRGLDFEITATDLKDEYLALGRSLAAKDGLSVVFEQQDALDLSNLKGGTYDVIVCTQSQHHFLPGLVTLMFSEASRLAGRGVLFIDGCRSMLSGVTATAFGLLRMRDPAWVHDAWVSTRKCFAPEELELLVRLARRDGTLESRWMAPGHCLLRWFPNSTNSV
jgi:2-polyprenyl-3-methyl-5-hydroxy-6-metoxy-1,4-benzoquinol methylase